MSEKYPALGTWVDRNSALRAGSDIVFGWRSCPVAESVVATDMYRFSPLIPSSSMMMAVSIVCTGRAVGNGGIRETSEVSSGSPAISGPRPGIANPPIWANRLGGGPLTRRTDSVIGG